MNLHDSISKRPFQPMKYYYILKARQLVQVETYEEYASFMNLDFESSRRVGFDRINQCRISTIFLGTDLSFGGSRPLVFETMIFCNSPTATEAQLQLDSFTERTSSWDEACAAHQRAVSVCQLLSHS